MHKFWKEDIETLASQSADFPSTSDQNFELTKMFGIRPDDVFKPNASIKNDALNMRTLSIRGSNKQLKLARFFPSNVGRIWAEVLRALDASQTAAKNSVAFPAIEN